jgi:hypothetical protein
MRTPAVDRAAHKKTVRADKKRLDSACTPRKRFSTRVKDQTGKSKKPLHAQPKKIFCAREVTGQGRRCSLQSGSNKKTKHCARQGKVTAQGKSSALAE